MQAVVSETERTVPLRTLKMSLRLESGESTTLEFPPTLDRCYTVGSSRDADVRVEHARIPPVALYFERRGSRIWLVPALRGVRLHVASRRVDAPCALAMSGTIEIANVKLFVELGPLGKGAPFEPNVFDAPTFVATSPSIHDTVEMGCLPESMLHDARPAPAMHAVDATEPCKVVGPFDDAAPTLVLVVRSNPAPAGEAPVELVAAAASPDSTQVAIKPLATHSAPPTKVAAVIAAWRSWLASTRVRGGVMGWLARSRSASVRRRVSVALAAASGCSALCVGVAFAVHRERTARLVVSDPHARANTSGASSKSLPAPATTTPPQGPDRGVPHAVPLVLTVDSAGAELGADTERTLAVTDLVAGRLESARERYASLAVTEPGTPVYAVIAGVLERRIAAGDRWAQAPASVGDKP